MDEHEAQAPQEYQSQEQLQKILKLLIEAPSDTIPLILCPNREQDRSLRESLQDWLRPMLGHQ